MLQQSKVNIQLLNLIRDNIGMISDPRKYEKYTMKVKKQLTSGGKFCLLRSHIFSGFTLKI